MNGPFVVAQAGSSANSGSAPVQIIKLTKPEAGQTEIFHASFNGVVKIDFTAIANEKITLFHDSKNQSLHIIFADGSQDIIEPFFDSRGTILTNLVLEMGPDVTYSGEQFAQTLTISEDPSVLPAAGPGGVASGADFLDAVVDPFGLTNPLDLLPPEELPNLNFTVTQAPIIITEEENLTPTVSGHVSGIVEEEQLTQEEVFLDRPQDHGQGNEDTHDVSGNDTDTSIFPPGDLKVTQAVSGTLAGLVVGGDLPITFLANSAANGAVVHDSNGNIVTSLGSAVQYVFVSSTEIEGWTFSGGSQLNLVFILDINPDGTFTFTLNDQIDHPTHSHDDGTHPQGIFEETLNIDLSTAVVAHDATPDPVVFPTNTFDIGVIDDTPVTCETTPYYPQPYFDGEGGSETLSQALDDENQPGGIQGGPGDDGFGKHLFGQLDIRYGADGPSQFECGVGTNPLVFDPSKIIVTNDKGDQIALSEFNAIYVDGNGVGTQHAVNITWTDGWFGGGTLTGTADNGQDGTFDVFKLIVQPDGSYCFILCAPLAHPFTNDGVTEGQTAWEDNLHIQFTYTGTDFDGDSIDGHVTINVDDDVPSVADNQYEHAQAAVALDESVGNDASNPGDSVQSNPPGDDTGNPAPTFPLPTAHVDNPVAFGSATIDAATIADLFSASPGADGEGSHAYTLVLRDADGTPTGIGDAFVQTNLSITDFTATGNPTPVYGDDTIYLVQVSNTQINGLVAGVDGIIGNADDQLALQFIIDPSTGGVTVEQYLAIHHNDAGDTPLAYDDLAQMFVVGEGENGGIFVNYSLTDGDGDTASAISDAPISVTIQDDGIAVDVAQATNGENSDSFVTLDTLVLDESIQSDRGPDSNHDGSIDDNNVPPVVTTPSYITTANSTLAIGITSTPTTVSGSGTSIAALFTVTKTIGSDGLENENKVYSLTLTDANGDPVLSPQTGVLTNLHVTDTGGSPVAGSTEDHRAIYLYQVSATEIDGVMGHDTIDPSDDFVALRILLTGDPADPVLQVEQYLPLEHPLTGADHFDESVLLNFAIIDGELNGASLGVTLTDKVTDGDGDTSTDSQTVTLATAADSDTSSGTSFITFEDDGPSASLVINSGVTLTVDETAGQDAGTNDVATTPALLALFAALPGIPIQIAQSGAALFTTGSEFGTDGPSVTSSSAFGLNVVDGADSGLNATDGRSIYLYHEGNLIVGREGDVGTDAANAAGPVALAFSIDSGTGTLTLAEYTAIQHPNPLDPNEAGSPQTITNSALQVTFTVTDGDGDVSTASAGIGNLIQFRDDGPSITPPSNLIVNGSFEEGHPNLVGADWDIYSSLPGWTEGANHIPFEVQTGGVGGIAAEDGDALVELDGDRTGNPAHQPPSGTPDPFNTDCTIQQVISGTQAGVDYELTFWYTPRPGHSFGNDDGLGVLWNGNVVHTIDSSGQPEGVWQQITLFVTGTGPGDTLAFQGEGDQDEFGAFIDNVSLIQAVVVDEDGLPSGNHDSQPGDIVVPNTDGDNNEATSTGQLNINWGADNFDAAPDTHVGGNPVLGFVQDSGGRSVTFTDTTVGITGGTLTSHGDAITLTLSPDHTVLTGTAQHGATVRTVFEVSLSDDNTGAFRFILQDALDHAAGSNENNIMLTFDFTATDSDGDPALGHFQVLVNDDIPVAVNDVDSVSGAGHTATGNVITGIDLFSDANTTDGNADHVGADGPGKITQVVGFGATFATAHNFQVVGQFGTLVLTENGDYIYQRTSASVGTDHFTYTLSDHDGDTSTASLDISVSPVAHDDTVITNIAGSGAAIGIPDLALLLNDIDISGPSVSSVGGAISGAIGHDALTTTTTFTDDNLDGGSFNYTIVDNGTPSTAHVTVDRLQVGHSELDGTSANEILIGTTSADTLVGNGGSDILVGNGGADHFLYNATTDGGTILNQVGADHILDFNTALGDSIDVSASAFGGGLVAGNDASGIFGSSADDTFASPTERFHLNTSTHTLLYDSNGSLAGGTQVALAVLEHAATVDATHIHAVA